MVRTESQYFGLDFGSFPTYAYVIAAELTLDEEAELETDARHMSLKIMLCNLDT